MSPFDETRVGETCSPDTFDWSATLLFNDTAVELAVLSGAIGVPYIDPMLNKDEKDNLIDSFSSPYLPGFPKEPADATGGRRLSDSSVIKETSGSITSSCPSLLEALASSPIAAIDDSRPEDDTFRFDAALDIGGGGGGIDRLTLPKAFSSTPASEERAFLLASLEVVDDDNNTCDKLTVLDLERGGCVLVEASEPPIPASSSPVDSRVTSCAVSFDSPARCFGSSIP